MSRHVDCRVLRRGSLFALALVSVCVTYGPATEQLADELGDPREAWSQSDRLLLELEILAPPHGSFSSAVVQLKATNTGRMPIRIDRELIVGFGFGFISDIEPTGEGAKILTEENAVVLKDLVTLERPEPALSLRRFIDLEPGESLTREIDFSNRLRIASSGRNWLQTRGGHLVHEETFGESTWNVSFPDKANAIELSVFYDPYYSPSLFSSWFGAKHEEFGPWRGRAWTAPLLMRRLPEKGVRIHSPNDER